MKEAVIKIDKLKKVLKVLCIITFIGSAAVLLASVFSSLMSTTFVKEYYTTIFEETGKDPDLFFSQFKNAGSIGTIKIVLSCLSIFGAVLMYRMKIKGLYIYALAQIAMLFVSPIIKGADKFSLTETIITLIWISLYGIIFYIISKENK